MARSRNIKPGFFKNEDLAECSAWARLCFAGLWTLADREGRLEDRARRIKGELFAFDTVEVEPLLKELDKFGFIVRYTVDGRGFIEIVAFHKHQHPHQREPESVIPSPQSTGRSPDDTPPKHRALPTCDEPQAPDKHRTLQSKVDLAGGVNRAVSGIDESGALYPERNTATSVEVACHRPSADGPQLTLVEPSATKPRGPPDCPHGAVLRLWTEVLPALPQHEPEQWKGARADHLRARWRETAATKRWAAPDDGLTYLRKLFAYVGQSPFLTGQEHDPKRRPFFVTLAWLVKPDNWSKTIEGEYHAAKETA